MVGVGAVVGTGLPSEARVDRGSVTEVQITGRNGIAANAEAVAINLAAVNPTAPGYLTAYPCGSDRPDTSTVNHDTSLATSNASIVPIGDNGTICIYNLTATDILVDVTGWFPANSDYTPITPNRHLDTRNNNRPDNTSVTEVQITGRNGIAANAEAVAINLAAVNPTAPGYLTAYPCGSDRPDTSTVNHDTSLATSNASIVPIGDNGTICIYNLTATDILVDVTGWFPANSDYTPITPNRHLDTRNNNRPDNTSVTEVQITGRNGIAANAEAVAINLAAVNPTAPGYLTAYPCGSDRPDTSTVNHDTSLATSNASIVPIGDNGTICIYNLTATDILVDVTGWFPANSDYTPITPNRHLDTRTPGVGSTAISEEFEGDEIDSDMWAVVERVGDLSNDDEQCYLPANVAVADGALHITTRDDTDGCASIGVDARYSSGMVQWRTASFTYGRLEVRARVGGGTGPWPAIWLLGTDCQPNNPFDANDIDCNWPEPGADEIDIVEYLGGDFSTLNQQIHSTDGHPQCLVPVDDPIRDWHVYGLQWDEDRLVFDIDGVISCELTQAVPSTPMFLIVNTAVGGFGGGDIDPGTMPVEMLVDWVHVEPRA